MGTGEIELPIREPRRSRRRPGVSPPKVERISPRSGLARAEVMVLQRHGYEDTKITDIVELAGVSRPTFYEFFEGKEQCFAAAYADGIRRLSSAVEAAAGGRQGWVPRISAGLRAGLEFLAADPSLANLLLVESLAAARPARPEHERTLARLAGGLRPAPGDPRLLAGGLASYLFGQVLAGEAERLPESYDLLLVYFLTPPLPATARSADERRA
jgi:AcrR family transcriptional regulator